MSTAAATPDLSKSTPETYTVGSSFAALLSTLIALVAAVLALVDLFAHGLGQTLVHLTLGLAVFGAVRLCVGVALDPYRPTEHDNPESSP